MPLDLNLDLLIVGVAVSATVLLGFIIYFQNRQSVTGKFFLLFSVVSSIWAVVEYLIYQFTDSKLQLFFIRSTMFMATWQAFSFFMLATVFPGEKYTFSKIVHRVLIPLVVIVSLFTYSPFFYSGLKPSAIPGGVSEAIKAYGGVGMLPFMLLAVPLVLFGLVSLIINLVKSQGIERKRFYFFLLGTFLMFVLIIPLVFILPTSYQNYHFIPYAAAFIFPFIFFTAYSIYKHKLFQVKVLSSEILVFALSVVSLVQVIRSVGYEKLFWFCEFLLVLGFGVLLVKSVIREVKQREELQVLSKELEKVNGELKELDKARADFITIASHQLRTPPATIKWYVAAILSGDFGALLPDVKAQLEKVQVTNNSQISLIDDMLNASRIERGKMEFLFEEVEVEPMAKMTYDQLMPLAGMKGIKLVYNPPKTPLPKVMADIEKLRQVMNNFIDNAIKYTDKGIITAELFQEGDNIRFQVTDNGMGIKTELAPHLFTKYARGQDSVTHAQGLGLGLYVCKMVVDQHHGKIWAESPGEGKGSTFIFTVPIHNNLKATTLVDLNMAGVK